MKEETEETVQFAIRIPWELRERIRIQAFREEKDIKTMCIDVLEYYCDHFGDPCD